MLRIYSLLDRVAPGDISILLLGETGVGKEVAARSVHARSARSAGPFVALNCASFSSSLLESELFGHEKGAFTGAMAAKPGLLEAADGGTLFLDEIGEMPAPVQATLLRVLEDRTVLRVGAVRARPIDVRIVSATNRALEVEVAAGRFRKDLYYRLSGIAVEIPPLRDRPTEILPLAHRALESQCKAPKVLSSQVEAALRAWSWPGNVRELRNVMVRAALLAGRDEIEVKHLGFGGDLERLNSGCEVSPSPPRLRTELEALERDRILRALETAGGNQTRAAKALGMPRRTFVARLDAYGIARPRRR
ncbi:MAG: sigma 54-interacting transcriptional regulator [Polyangiaceae bacterium]